MNEEMLNDLGGMKVNFVRFASQNEDIFHEAMGLYQKSFPYHEQRECASQQKILREEEYHFDLIYQEDRFIGLLLYWETQGFLYVEHFCIDPGMRNHGYGQAALDLLKKRGKTVILEIDPPADEKSFRRQAFYKRAGFRENAFRHVHPPYHQGNPGHALVVMSFPQELSQMEYGQFASYLDGKVMAGI